VDEDAAVSSEGRAILDRILAEVLAVSDSDAPYVAGQLLRMAEELLGPDLWLVTLEGLFLLRAQDLLDRHVAIDQDRERDQAPGT
jgi:hypothetical protein